MNKPQRPNILDPLDKRQPRLLDISWAGLLVGLILGLTLGLLYAWLIDPVIVRNTAPADLHPDDKQVYIVVAAQEYAANGNLERFVNRLRALEPNRNPFEVAANTACQLIQRGQVDELTDIAVIRSLRAIYEPQGFQAACDLTAFNTPVPLAVVIPTATITPSPTITPAASKTATQVIEPAPLNTAIPSMTPISSAGGFQVGFIETFCDVALSGVIEVYARDEFGVGLAGVAIEVRDQDRQAQIFYTGLKPERGDGYADFSMSEGGRYRVGVRSEGQSSRELEATPCDGSGTLISYRVVIQRLATAG